MHNNPPRLVVFEGLDGSGKSTQVKLLARHLRRQRQVVHVMRQPHTLRKYTPHAGEHGLYVYLADQALMLPLIKQSTADYILVDRWITSTHVYGPHNTAISAPLHNCYPTPDLLIYLDMPPERAHALASGRANADEYDKAPLKTYQARHQRYLELLSAPPYDAVHVQLTPSNNPQETHTKVLQCLHNRQLAPAPTQPHKGH